MIKSNWGTRFLACVASLAVAFGLFSSVSFAVNSQLYSLLLNMQPSPDGTRPPPDEASLAYLEAMLATEEYYKDINVQADDGTFPLHMAVQGFPSSDGHLVKRIAGALIAHGAEINCGDANGQTPLHYAVSRRNYIDVGFLLENGADPNIKDSTGATPLHYAAKNGDIPMMACLLKCDRMEVDIKDNAGNTPLHIACKSGRSDVIAPLISNGFDLKIFNKEDESAFDVACAHCDAAYVDYLREIDPEADKIHGHKSIITLPVDRAWARIVNEASTKGNTTALHLAVICPDYHPLVLYAIHTQASHLNDVNSEGDTALHLALRKGYLDVAKLLIKNPNVDVNKKGKHGHTPLDIAKHRKTRKGYSEVINLMEQRLGIGKKQDCVIM